LVLLCLLSRCRYYLWCLASTKTNLNHTG
jgi:hypothetical protein